MQRWQERRGEKIDRRQTEDRQTIHGRECTEEETRLSIRMSVSVSVSVSCVYV